MIIKSSIFIKLAKLHDMKNADNLQINKLTETWNKSEVEGRSTAFKLMYLIYGYFSDSLHPYYLKQSINPIENTWSIMTSLAFDDKVNKAGYLLNEHYKFEFLNNGNIRWVNKDTIYSKTYIPDEDAADAYKEKNKGYGSLEEALTWDTPLALIGSLDNLIEYMKKQGLLTEQLTESLLLEKSRAELISKSKSGADYKSDKSKGRNRWERRVHSKIATSVSDYNKIDMNTFWKSDSLKFDIKVTGETDNYVVTVIFENILARLRREIEDNQNKLEFKNVLRALINTFNSEDVYISCTCPDFVYGGFNYYSYHQKYNSEVKTGPALDAPVIRNPNDNLGAACKHINLVLANLTWMMKIASVINNYIWYCKDHMELNYGRYIFPQLYGMDYDKAIQMTMDMYDENGNIIDDFASDEETINLSNALGRRRTQFKPRGVPGGNPRFERERKEKPLSNELKLKFDDEEEQVEEEPKIKEPEPEVGNEDEGENING